MGMYLSWIYLGAWTRSENRVLYILLYDYSSAAFEDDDRQREGCFQNDTNLHAWRASVTCQCPRYWHSSDFWGCTEPSTSWLITHFMAQRVQYFLPMCITRLESGCPETDLAAFRRSYSIYKHETRMIFTPIWYHSTGHRPIDQLPPRDCPKFWQSFLKTCWQHLATNETRE